MINSTQFQIIGRIGSINRLEHVTHLSLPSDRGAKDQNDKWVEMADWNLVTIFSKKLRKLSQDDPTSRHSNLVIVQGTILSKAFMKDDEKHYRTSLVADQLKVLSFAKVR